MRIDSARNQIGAAATLLARVDTELQDLHVLAYERLAAAADLERVRGGSRDYALDTHGDPRVRQAYREFSDAVSAAAELIEDAAHGLLKRLRDGDSPAHKTPRTVTAFELALVIEAKARRLRRGEYTPHRNEEQQGVDSALQAAMQENQRLTRENQRLTKQVEKLETRGRRTRGATADDRDSTTSGYVGVF